MNLVKAETSDLKEIVDVFIDSLVDDPSYISHGEMQMGLIDYKTNNLTGSHREIWADYCLQMIQGSNSEVYLLKSDQSIDAFAIVEKNSSQGTFATLNDIVIRKGLRNAGLGKKFIEKIFQLLVNQGVREVFAESGKDNHSAHRFLNKTGFEQTSIVLKKKLI